jgi:hypothetical protein
MLTDAGLAKFNLRVVFMCNCFASSVNADWVAIGARASIGSKFSNFMPEPSITFFINDFVVNNLPANTAAANAFNGSKAMWTNVAGYNDVGTGSGGLTRIQSSEYVVAGPEPTVRFTDIRLSVGESRTMAVYASQTHNFANVYVYAGERYQFTQSSSDTWRNLAGTFFETVCNAAGYGGSIADFARRHPDLSMFCLVGEQFNQNNNALSYNGTYFRTATASDMTKEKTFTSNGYLAFFANDIITGYGDNSGQISLTITRLANP